MTTTTNNTTTNNTTVDNGGTNMNSTREMLKKRAMAKAKSRVEGAAKYAQGQMDAKAYREKIALAAQASAVETKARLKGVKATDPVEVAMAFKVEGIISSTLVKHGHDPRLSLGIAAIFGYMLNDMSDMLKWERDFGGYMSSLVIDSEVYKDIDWKFLLLETKLLDTRDGMLVQSDSLKTLLKEEKKAYAPYKASEGITDRRYDMKQPHISALMSEAIRYQEANQYTRSDIMYDIVKGVMESSVKTSYKIGAKTKTHHEILAAEGHVIQGTGLMDSSIGYVSEFKPDPRGRMNQACHYGPNGQSSDLARALMDLYGVTLDYDRNLTRHLLNFEMTDMSDYNADEIDDIIPEVVKDPVAFVLEHLGKDKGISKPWNFVKFALLCNEIDKGNTPYVGVAVGKDAKASGPQYGAILVDDVQLMIATGFSLDEVNDVYERAVDALEAAGIHGLTRSLVKKIFMSIFYGAGVSAMIDVDTITEATYNVLYSGMEHVQKMKRAQTVHDVIEGSFGKKLSDLRKSFSRAGMDYSVKPAICKINAPVSYTMPDGFQVEMDYMKHIDQDGNPVFKKAGKGTVVVESKGIRRFFKKPTFKTNELDLPSHIRTGFVNFIQAIDAMIARLIIVHFTRLGGKHIIGIHDCFRTSVVEQHLLDEAIVLAYLDLFGTEVDTPTSDMPYTKDMLSSYSEGVFNATKEEYLETFEWNSQFFDNGARNVSTLLGVPFTDLVKAMATTGKAGTKFFS